MGILNVTPDSFSDDGKLHTEAAAVDTALSLSQQGAQIIDVGGESTRPGYQAVPLEQELARVLPVVRALSQKQLCVSIDTHKTPVMQAALLAGASIVNDVNALCSEGAVELLRGSDCGVVIMDGFSFADQTAKRAGQGLVQRIAARYATLCAAGIAAQRIVIDPGIGFDKTLDENLACIQLLPQLRLIAPVLIGASRKSFLGQLTGQAVEHRLAGSLSAALEAARLGAAVLRVHDVQATRDVMSVWRALNVAQSVPDEQYVQSAET